MNKQPKPSEQGFIHIAQELGITLSSEDTPLIVAALHRAYGTGCRDGAAAVRDEYERSKGAVRWPRNAAEVREFMHTHCEIEEYAVGPDAPDDGDRFQLTAHDFLSAVNWWADFPHHEDAGGAA